MEKTEKYCAGQSGVESIMRVVHTQSETLKQEVAKYRLERPDQEQSAV